MRGGVWLSLLVKLNQVVHGPVEPSSSLNVVQTCDDDVELLVKLFIVVLNGLSQWSDLDSRASLHDKLGCH